MLLQVPLWWRPRPRQRQRRRRLSLRSSSFLRSGRRTYAGADFVMSTVYTVRYQIPVHTSKNISANNLELWFVDRRCKGMQKVRPVQIIERSRIISKGRICGKLVCVRRTMSHPIARASPSTLNKNASPTSPALPATCRGLTQLCRPYSPRPRPTCRRRCRPKD